MKKYFARLRVYRKKDQHYITVFVTLDAPSMHLAVAQVSAFEVGLKVAGSTYSYTEALYADWPLAGGGDYLDMQDPLLLEALMVFLGTKRDRKIKENPVTTETSDDLQPDE
jgi:hypothetical protein